MDKIKMQFLFLRSAVHAAYLYMSNHIPAAVTGLFISHGSSPLAQIRLKQVPMQGDVLKWIPRNATPLKP